MSAGRAQLACALALALGCAARVLGASRGEIALGLDFEGGGRLVLEVDGGETSDWERACDVVRERIDGERVESPSVLCRGDEIEVQLGASDQDALDALGRRLVDTHSFAFQKVDDETDVLGSLTLPEGVTLLDEHMSSPDRGLHARYLAASGPRAEELLTKAISAATVPSGRRLVLAAYVSSDLEESGLRTYLVHDTIEIGGDSVAGATLNLDDPVYPAVEVELDRTGAQKFEDLTGAMIGRRVAVVVDGRVLMAPLVMGKIGGGKLRISLGSGPSLEERLAEGRELARSLRSGGTSRPIRVRHSLAIRPAYSPEIVQRAVTVVVAALLGFGVVMSWRHRVSAAIAAASPWLTLLLFAALYLHVGAVVTVPGVLGGVLFAGITAGVFAALAEPRSRPVTRPTEPTGRRRPPGWVMFGAAHVVLLVASAAAYAATHGWWRGFSFGAMLGAVASLTTTLLLGSAVHARVRALGA